MRKFVFSSFITLLVSVVLFTHTIKAQEIACWQVTASVLNVRSGPGINFAIQDTLAYGTTINGTSNGVGWVQRDIGGWSAQQYLIPCSGNTFSNQVNATTTTTNNVVETFNGNVIVVNRPYWMDGNDVSSLRDIVRSRSVVGNDIACAERPLVIYFGTEAEGQALIGQNIYSLLGYYDIYTWDGTHLGPSIVAGCEVHAHGIFVLQGRGIADTWETIGHELGHMYWAGHGASSPRWVNDADTDTGFEDAYWIGYEVEKAANSNCGASPSEFCQTVYQILH